VKQQSAKQPPYKLLLFTCYGGCATGVAASKACIRIWEENPDDIKIGCLPALVVPWKLNEIMAKSEKRILIDACGVRCGGKLAQKEGLAVDRYLELTSALRIRKTMKLPSKELEDKVYKTIKQEVDLLLDQDWAKAETRPSENIVHREALPDMRLRPVGVVRNGIKQPHLVARDGDLEWKAKIEKARDVRDAVSELEIDSDLTAVLDGIEDFSHLLVLYWAHRVSPEGRSLRKGHPMGRKDFPLVGIFATRSPARPNPICMTIVPLLERKGNILKVQGLDAIDGSPVLDIKPYNPNYDAAHGVKLAEWMDQIDREFTGNSVLRTPIDGNCQTQE